MTVEELKRQIDVLAAITGDDEAAHAYEDALRRDVLAAIAAGAPGARELARLALTTDALVFERWCA